jgi:hypothetical protein
MDKVVLDGIEYVKASAVAKQFHYTSDYIGQLCRAKKIDARLVGRTWFVRPESLTEHKKTTHQKPQESVDTSTKVSPPDDLASMVKINRIDVNAPLKNKTAKSTTINADEHEVSPRLENGSTTRISYHTDTQTLLPNLSEKRQPDQTEKVSAQSSVKKFLHIEPAFAKKLKIAKNKQKHVSFNPTALPEVALSGKLNVSTYQDSRIEPIEKTAPTQTGAPVPPPDKSMQRSTKVVKPEVKSTEPIGFPKAHFSQNRPPSLWIRMVPLLITLMATTVSFLLLTAVSEVTVTDSISTSKVSLVLDNFWALFAQ